MINCSVKRTEGRANAFQKGVTFVRDMHERYGLLEAYRMAGEYLATQAQQGLGTTWQDTDEEAFCQGIRAGMCRLDAM